MNMQIVIDSLTTIITDIISFIPNVVNGVIILIVGFLLASIVRVSLQFSLERLRFNSLIERTGISAALRGLGVQVPLSRILAQIVFSLLLLSFLITATRLMGLEAVAQLLEQLLVFLPNIIAALVIFVLGGMAAQFVGGLIHTALLTSGIANAERVGKFVQYVISTFVIILALGQLGVDTAMLITALTIIIAAFGLALGLALGLGARSVVGHILAGFYLRQRVPIGTEIRIGDIQGVVNNIGPVNLELTSANTRIVVANTTVLEAVLQVHSLPA